MFPVGAVFTAHPMFERTAPLAFKASGTMNMFSGRSLKAAVAIRGGTAVNTAIFTMVMLMEPVGALGAAMTVGGSTAKSTF